MKSMKRNLPFSLPLRGWALGENLEAVTRDVLGAVCIKEIAPRDADRWYNEVSLPPGQPLGPIDSCLTMQCEEPSWIEVIPGSQGQEAPPPGIGEPAFVSVRIEKGLGLALDARCWYRLVSPHRYRIRCWRRRLNGSAL